MEIVFDKKRLLPLLRDFHTITGLRVGVFDLACKEVAAYPVKLSGFCRLIRSRPEGLERCLSCDRAALELSGEKAPGEIHIYQCHAGLTEAAAPICNGEEVLGFLMFGQMRRTSQPQGQCRKVIKDLSEMGIPADNLQSAFSSLPLADEEHILACARVLRACAVSVWLEDCIRLQCESLPRRAKQYITAHLDEPLSLERLCDALGTGKTMLCSQVKKQYGCTAGEMIRNARLDKARQLLERTDIPVCTLAEQVGIPDYNYFTRLFRKHTGETPTAYRRRLRRETQ